MYEKMGGLVMTNSEDSDKLDKIKFQTAIASRSCKYGVEKCIEDAKALFKKLQGAPNEPNPYVHSSSLFMAFFFNTFFNRIPKDLTSVVYCTALKHGGENEWYFLWNKYQQSNVASEKSSLLSVLACTREIWLLTK